MGVAWDNEAKVDFDVPRLADVLREEYTQGELFPSRPDGDDTVFDLVGDVLADLATQDEESDRFDTPLLRSICGLDRVVNGKFGELLISGRRYQRGEAARLDQDLIATAERLVSKTPEAVRVRLVGEIDSIRKSTQAFALTLEDGHEVKGVYSGDDFAAVCRLFSEEKPHQVVVRGEAFFRPSGRLLLVDAVHISLAVNESSLFSKLPRPADAGMDKRGLHRRQGPRSGIAAVMGQWPGDESEDEFLAALEDLS